MNRQKCLIEAINITTKERESQYGSPEDNFGAIASMWTEYLAARASAIITPEDVAAMMILLKVARIAGGSGKTDNWVDIAGYAACGCEIETEAE